MGRIKCGIWLFLTGGILYTLVELLWRGHSHWSMFCVGGLCFHLVGAIGKKMRRMRMLTRCVTCSAAISAVEFCSGCLVNLKWRMDVWDYSHMPLNLLGQVCLFYTVLWGGLSALAMPAYAACHRFYKKNAY